MGIAEHTGEKEVPLAHCVRLRNGASPPWVKKEVPPPPDVGGGMVCRRRTRGGDSARSLRSLAEWCVTALGRRGKKMGGGGGRPVARDLISAAHLFPFFPPCGCTIPRGAAASSGTSPFFPPCGCTIPRGAVAPSGISPFFPPCGRTIPRGAVAPSGISPLFGPVCGAPFRAAR